MRLVQGMVGILILFALVAPAAANPGARIEWETETPSVLFRHVSEAAYFGDTSNTPRILLQAELSGRLLSLAPADTALFAVFVRDAQELNKLTHLLSEIGCPKSWPAKTPCPLTAEGSRASYERIRIDRGGRLVILADEARHPSSNYLAVVNGAGEILGSRPVWTAPSRTGAMANNEANAPR